ncbi:uncharacterized protein F5891DRAFT_1180305 [Suillus fuscotomentosus]|uniref:Uncharacterized protein n=1 Tax=Suillus fuscotomentosus TaxID=1912939 RepID=A0AAD4EMF9_9AGAM|nr:uncharacterized protein F5891DRAFT_1180305 [Suillus fuscotomentosus]KAG1908761.1 hypothetical protein F5891DRAFT_1180305 [Suillus fuscotomentosus]
MLTSIILLGSTSSILDMETWCADWDEFLKKFGACQTEALERHITLPLTAAVGAKGDECITTYPCVQDAITIAWKEAAEYEKKMEEECWIAEDEEEHMRKAEEEALTHKAAEAEELARTTAEAEEVAWKTAEVEELTCKTVKAIFICWLFYHFIHNLVQCFFVKASDAGYGNFAFASWEVWKYTEHCISKLGYRTIQLA